MAERVIHAAADLSYGRKRVLELATTLALEPKVLLLDEPMAGMGHEDIGRISDLIRRIARNRTVLMVEHHMEVLLGLVERVAVLHFGTLLTIDTPEAVMADPTVQSAYLGEAV